MRTIIVALSLLAATWTVAQDRSEIDELRVEQDRLERQLEENRRQIESLKNDAGPFERERLEEWEVELEEEFEKLNEYLVELPQDLSRYYVKMRETLGELLETIDESWSETRTIAERKISDADRRYRRAREHAHHQDRVYDLRARAREIEAGDEAETAIKALEASLAALDAAQQNIAAAEREVERRAREAEIADRKVEMLLLEIETRRLEDSLEESAH